MKYYKKFKILQALRADVGDEPIFYPDNATKLYGISFPEHGFKMGRDYDVFNQAFIDKDGAKPYDKIAHFTNKGVKRLLKVSPQARARIDEIWKEYIVNAGDY
ncbi:hypothetical protein [Campylobacter sp. RM16190]|uniref:hypothetical protein n=1 Tax=Campylobacter sp. RM16190 TaxID=1705727 RepID=UPI001475056F|nr:hypothetical protein [Campylobacter sp. RM16190]